AKFLCRDAKDAAAGVRPGIYETSTNIRNPELPLGSPQPGDLGIDDRAQVTLKLGVGSLFVHTGQAAVSSHIGRQDGCEPSLYTLGGQSRPPLVTRSKQLPAARQALELMRTPLREFQAGARYKVRYHSRYENFAGAGKCHDARSSMDGYAADVLIPD